MRKLY